MHCAGCAGRVEKALRAVPGVRAAAVNFALESARVEMDAEAAVERTVLADATKHAGYTASFEEDAADAGDKAIKAELAVSVLLTAPLVAPMIAAPFGVDLHLPAALQAALAAPVQFFVGRRFYFGAYAALRTRAANMDVLVALGTSAAFLYSLALTLAGQTETGLYFEASAVIITLVLLGKMLEGRAKDRATGAIKALLALTPMVARRLAADGSVEDIQVSTVRVEDHLVVRQGDTVPVDGIVIHGAADLDERHLTGESLPVTRRTGAFVAAGAGNVGGLLTIRATAVGKNTRLAQITALVRSAQSKKAPVQKLVDRITAVFVPVIVAVALTTFCVWLALGLPLDAAVGAAVSVLIIACPCALGLAAPAAIAAGLGAAARSGILIADLEAVERATRINTIVFDKTGTVTAGAPEITRIVWAGGEEDSDALAAAVAIQAQNTHPLAQPFAALSRSPHDRTVAVAAFEAVPGCGVSASVDGKPVLIGNADLMAARGIPVPEDHTADSPGTTVYLAVDGTYRAAFTLVDQVRPTAATALRALARGGMQTMLFSGDTPREAKRIGTDLGFDRIEGGMLPADKAAGVEELRAAGRPVAMVGDGINDAPALAAADLGIAMAGGTDVAIQTAGITLMRPDPRLVPAALEISRRTVAKIRQNLFWAFFYNSIGIPLAAVGFLSPALAGTAMALSSVCVVGNALLLAAWRPREEAAQ